MKGLAMNQEAIFLGRQAVKALHEGKSQVMLGLPDQVVDSAAGTKVQLVTFGDTAGLERSVDPCFLTEWGISPSFTAWLQNRMGEPLAGADSAHQVWFLASQQERMVP